MTTKEKILEKSLELFNRDGLDGVTVRHIAKALEMSHGNLCYHFPTIDAIIEGLYSQMAVELDATTLSMRTIQRNPSKAFAKGESNIFRTMYDLSLSNFEKLYEYRFIMLDFVSIMRRIPAIKAHYRQQMVMRQLQFQFLVTELVKKGLFKPPIIENQYSTWIHSAILFGDFWLSSAEILYNGKESDKVKIYHRFFISLTIPYLTEKGLEEMKELL